MMDDKFKEVDKEKVVEFLNLVATHGKFELTTKQVIEYFKLLSHMQQVILPKINANIFEVVKVVEPKKEEPPAEEPKKPRSRKKE